MLPRFHRAPSLPNEYLHHESGKQDSNLRSVRPKHVCLPLDTIPWCTDVESNDVLAGFSRALSPDQLSVRAPYANRTRLSGLKDPGPHQRSNGALALHPGVAPGSPA